MTIKEEFYSIAENFTEQQLTNIVAFFKDMERLHEKELEEIFDEQFCMTLLNRYDRYGDKNDKGTPIEKLAEKWGVDLYSEDDD